MRTVVSSGKGGGDEKGECPAGHRACQRYWQSSLQLGGGYLCLPFISLNCTLYTLICSIFLNPDNFFKSPGLSPTHTFCRTTPPPSLIITLFFLSKLPLAVLYCFCPREGRGRFATQLHPDVECYSTTHSSSCLRRIYFIHHCTDPLHLF